MGVTGPPMPSHTHSPSAQQPSEEAFGVLAPRQCLCTGGPGVSQPLVAMLWTQLLGVNVKQSVCSDYGKGIYTIDSPLNMGMLR